MVQISVHISYIYINLHKTFVSFLSNYKAFVDKVRKIEDFVVSLYMYYFYSILLYKMQLLLIFLSYVELYSEGRTEDIFLIGVVCVAVSVCLFNITVWVQVCTQISLRGQTHFFVIKVSFFNLKFYQIIFYWNVD